MTLTGQALAVLEADAKAVLSARATVATPAFAAVAAVLAGLPGKLLVTGAGTSGAIAWRAAHLFALVGCPAFYMPPSEGLHGGLGALRPGDYVLALSKGGASAELNAFCARARSLCSGIIALTAAPQSPFATGADHVLAIDLPPGGDLGGIVATASSLAMGALLDALAEVTRVARGTTWEALLLSHPSGAVGRDAGLSLARLSGEARHA